MIADPIEETFPFEGHTEFLAAAGPRPAARAARPELARSPISSGSPTIARRCARPARRAAGASPCTAPTPRRRRRCSLCGRVWPGQSRRAPAGAPEMFGLPLAFAAPAALAALALLAALYLFLKVTPPRPREVVFPPLRLLIGLDRKDATPAKTPWPLLLLRIVVAGLVIVAMAGPIWNALPGKGDGPLLIVLDDGWAAAPSWERRAAYARAALEAATRAGRLVALAPTSQGGLELAALDAPRGADRLRALAPVPYEPQRLATLPPIARFLAANPQTEVVWIADGVELGGATAFARALADAARGHKLSVVLDKTDGDRHRRRRQSRRRAAGASDPRRRRRAARGHRARARRAGPVDRRSALRLRLWAARPTRSSICRSSCATRSPASSSPTNPRPARPGWSTNARAAAASRSFPAPAPTSPSRCCRRPITSSARSRPTPRSARAARRAATRSKRCSPRSRRSWRSPI